MTQEYTLEEHIDVLDIAEGVALTVSADPDTSSMVNIRAVSPASKKFYGDLYISLVPDVAGLLAKSLRTCVTHIHNKMANDSHRSHTLIRKFRVYDDDNGAFIEVRPHRDDESYIEFWTPEKEGKEWWGDFDLSLLNEQALEIASAIEFVLEGLEHK